MELFSGVGGMHFALQEAGYSKAFTVKAAMDISDVANRGGKKDLNLKHSFPFIRAFIFSLPPQLSLHESRLWEHLWPHGLQTQRNVRRGHSHESSLPTVYQTGVGRSIYLPWFTNYYLSPDHLGQAKGRGRREDRAPAQHHQPDPGRGRSQVCPRRERQGL